MKLKYVVPSTNSRFYIFDIDDIDAYLSYDLEPYENDQMKYFYVFEDQYRLIIASSLIFDDNFSDQDDYDYFYASSYLVGFSFNIPPFSSDELNKFFVRESDDDRVYYNFNEEGTAVMFSILGENE